MKARFSLKQLRGLQRWENVISEPLQQDCTSRESRCQPMHYLSTSVIPSEK